MEASTVKRKVVKTLFEWLSEAFVKRLPNENELETPDVLWFSVEERILKLREIAMLVWECCVIPNPSQWEGPKDVPFANPIRCKMVREHQHTWRTLLTFSLLQTFVVGKRKQPDTLGCHHCGLLWSHCALLCHDSSPSCDPCKLLSHYSTLSCQYSALLLHPSGMLCYIEITVHQ